MKYESKYIIVEAEITQETLAYIKEQAQVNDLTVQSYIEDVLEKLGH